METIKATTTRRYRVPRVPNFVLHDDDEGKTHISYLSEGALKVIGEAWVRKLIARAEETRGDDRADALLDELGEGEGAGDG